MRQSDLYLFQRCPIVDLCGSQEFDLIHFFLHFYVHPYVARRPWLEAVGEDLAVTHSNELKTKILDTIIGKSFDRNAAYVGWQVKLCDLPVRHMSYRSAETTDVAHKCDST